MPDLDPERLERFVEPLTAIFYLLLAVAFLATVTGSPGSGFVFLILGAAAQVGRASIEELSAARVSRAPASRTAQSTRSTSCPEKWSDSRSALEIRSR
jgi:hypothetical protein